MRVIKGRSGKSTMVTNWLDLMEGRNILIIESKNLSSSSLFNREDAYVLQIDNNSLEETEHLLNVLDIGFEGENTRGMVVVFYLNTTLECLHMIKGFESKYGVEAIVTLQTDGELGEFII